MSQPLHSPQHTDLHAPLHIVVLAAGEGTRMKSNLPKVLHALGGRPMLLHLLDSAAALEPEAIHVVVGNGAERVRQACAAYAVNWVPQAERRGTGHAVLQAMPHIPDAAAVLVLLGDHPLVPLGTLQEMAQAAMPLAVLTMVVDDPPVTARVVRAWTAIITAVVEERDATPEQRTSTR
jgi:bifunctional UDP-N-acetylglucosamine pyrophosphorylase/glucosamine-1-phosphate N-acetyltransferase